VKLLEPAAARAAPNRTKSLKPKRHPFENVTKLTHSTNWGENVEKKEKSKQEKKGKRRKRWAHLICIFCCLQNIVFSGLIDVNWWPSDDLHI
jgi:hypothetical protein